MKWIILVAVATLLGWSSAADAQISVEPNVPWEPSQIALRADTFEFRSNGQVIGTQTVGIERAPGGFVFRETTTTPSGSQTTEVHFDEQLRMEAVRQIGLMGGQEMRIGVTYAGGRASGTARVPSAEGARSIMVDAPVPADVIDDNVLVSLLPALPWEPGAEWTVPVFASGKGELLEYTLHVGPVETIETPEGTREVYRVEVSGADRPLVFHVEAQPPHDLLKITLPGTPLEIVRTGALPEGRTR